jgi:hypothetical protein
VSEQKDVAPSAPKRDPNIVSEEKGLPSSAPEPKAEWTRKASAPVPIPASSTVRKSADRVETPLHVESDGHELSAAATLLVVLRRIQGVKKALEARLERSSTDPQIVDNVSAFWKHHNTNALDAVLVAATFGRDSESVTALSK